MRQTFTVAGDAAKDNHCRVCADYSYPIDVFSIRHSLVSVCPLESEVNGRPIVRSHKGKKQGQIERDVRSCSKRNRPGTFMYVRNLHVGEFTRI